MNYKLLANINYQVHAHTETHLTVKVDLENLKKFNEELIVQEHDENETSMLVEVQKLKFNEEALSVTINDAELKRFSAHRIGEEHAYSYMERLIEETPALKSLLALEIIDVESYRNPPAHEIRRQILSHLAIDNADYNDDDRGLSDDIYDGYVAPDCSSDGRPLYY